MGPHDARKDFFKAPDIAGYADVIKKPMHGGVILDKMKANGYKTMGRLIKDIKLIWSNCFQYNGKPVRNPDNFSAWAEDLQWAMDKYIKNLAHILTANGWIIQKGVSASPSAPASVSPPAQPIKSS